MRRARWVSPEFCIRFSLRPSVQEGAVLLDVLTRDVPRPCDGLWIFIFFLPPNPSVIFQMFITHVTPKQLLICHLLVGKNSSQLNFCLFFCLTLSFAYPALTPFFELPAGFVLGRPAADKNASLSALKWTKKYWDNQSTNLPEYRLFTSRLLWKTSVSSLLTVEIQWLSERFSVMVWTVRSLLYSSSCRVCKHKTSIDISSRMVTPCALQKQLRAIQLIPRCETFPDSSRTLCSR